MTRFESSLPSGNDEGTAARARRDEVERLMGFGVSPEAIHAHSLAIGPLEAQVRDLLADGDRERAAQLLEDAWDRVAPTESAADWWEVK